MKLYLTSMPPANKAELLKLVGDQGNLSVTVIPNAWDTYPAERKAAVVAELLGTFKGFGFTTSLLDVTTANKVSIETALKGKRLVWVMGGNTFYLNYYLHMSGFKDVIRPLLEGGLVYGGESAGAAVAGTTIHGIEHLDDPADAPEVAWDGLALVDYGILPHWGWEKYGEELSAAKKDMEQFARVVAIGNDQALVVDDGQETTVTNVYRQA